MTEKKVVNVDTKENRETVKNSNAPEWKPDEKSKAKAKQLRIIAMVSWLVAIVGEVFAIFLLQKPPVNTMVLIGLIVGIMVLAIAGSLLWKKANRLDPAKKKEKFKFFVQNQLGLIMSILAFLPLIILIFTNKDMDKNQKGLVGGIAVVALVIAGYFGIDFNPPSVEEYTEQTQEVVELTGQDYVYWTKSGTRYHLYVDCYTINGSRTEEINEGTVGQARALKNITELCKICKERWIKENPGSAHVEEKTLDLASVTNLQP